MLRKITASIAFALGAALLSACAAPPKDLDLSLEKKSAAGVPDLHDLVRRMSGQVDRLRRLDLAAAGKAKAVVRDHKRIVDAITSGDPEQARTSVREHLSGTLARIEEIRLQYPEYVV